MNNKVFISGSITITQLPDCIEDSIRKIKDQNLEILVGDADGIDTLVQDFCKILKNVRCYVVFLFYFCSARFGSENEPTMLVHVS